MPLFSDLSADSSSSAFGVYLGPDHFSSLLLHHCPLKYRDSLPPIPSDPVLCPLQSVSYTVARAVLLTMSHVTLHLKALETSGFPSHWAHVLTMIDKALHGLTEVSSFPSSPGNVHWPCPPFTLGCSLNTPGTLRPLSTLVCFSLCPTVFSPQDVHTVSTFLCFRPLF